MRATSTIRASVILAAGLAVWLTSALILWASYFPLGHDEAQYALAGKDVLAGVDQPRWVYLSSGMDAISVPGVLAGGSDRALRLLPMVIGIGFVLVAANLARRTTTTTTAVWLVAILAGARPLTRMSIDLLSDLPSAALLIVATTILASELFRGERARAGGAARAARAERTEYQGPRWRITAAAPCLAGALYVRYGSVVPIAILGVAAVATSWRAILRRPAPVIVTIVAFVVLLVPHFISANHLIGGPLGILLMGKTIPGGSTGDGLLTYITSDPFRYFGTTIPLPLVIGLALGWRGDRRRRFLWLVGIGDIVAIGLTTIGQSRYILLGTTLLVILGIDTIARWIEVRPPRVRPWLVGAAAMIVAWSWVATIRSSATMGETRATSMAGTLIAATSIRRDAHGAPCHLIGRHATQLEWYSGCAWIYEIDATVRPGEPTYIVRDTTGGPGQPELDAITLPHAILVEVPGVVRVVRVIR
jgi:hypothetical protein